MKTTLLALLVAVVPGFATDSAAPIPYKWGQYKAAKGSQKVVLVNWFSDEGRKRLSRSRYNNDFFQMAHAYQPQISPVYAGVATSVVILNALRLPSGKVPSQKEAEVQNPKALGGQINPFPSYGQSFYLNEQTDKVKDRKVVALQNVTRANENDKDAFKPGTSLEDLKGFFEIYGAKADVVLATAEPKAGAAEFRKTVKAVLKDHDRFLLSNFKGEDFGAATGGTVSPLAAYDEKSDSVLILDVTGHKNPWYWVPLEDLYAAMHTEYDGHWRGYAIVAEGGAR